MHKNNSKKDGRRKKCMENILRDYEMAMWMKKKAIDG